MPLVRRLARPALAAMFISGGLTGVRHPDYLVPTAQPVADRVGGLLRRALPEPIASKIPTDTASLVRLNGGVQLVGGLLLATGRAPRLASLALVASLLPTTAAGHAFWSEDDAAAKANQKVHFTKNIGLLGGLLLAAVDTAGKPGLTWRAKRASKDVKRQAKHAKSQARHAGTQARYARAEARNKVSSVAGSVTDALPFG